MLHRVLIIGVGSIGHRHLRCFQTTNRVQLEICETNQALADDLARQYGVQRVFGSLDDALVDPPDAAVICTPAHLHIPMAHQLANRGVDLLIEKPLSTSIDGIEELQQLITQRELVCAIAYVMRQHPLVESAKQAVHDKSFGALLQLTVTSGQDFPFYRPAYRETYYAKHTTGGGAIQDAITHMMNSIQWIAGRTTALVCDAAHQQLPGVSVEDTVHVMIRHGAIMGSLTLNQFQSPNETTLQLNFERGSTRYEFHNNKWAFSTEPEAGWLPGGQYKLERDDLFTKQANVFLDCIEQRTTPTCDLHDALHTLHTNLAMLESNQTKQWFHIP